MYIHLIMSFSQKVAVSSQRQNAEAAAVGGQVLSRKDAFTIMANPRIFCRTVIGCHGHRAHLI